MTEVILPKISVITVTKDIINANRSHGLRLNIDSVRSQSYKGCVEHIFVDSASMDGTAEILKDLCPINNIEYIVISEPDKGIYDAMNKGIRLATGEFLIFLNSDDYFASDDALDNLVKEALDRRVDFVYGYFRNSKNGQLSSIRKAELGLFFVRMPFCHQAMLCKKTSIIEVGCFDSTRFRSAGDFDLVLRLLLNGATVSCCHEVVVVFSDGGVSSNRGLGDSEVLQSILLNLKKYYSFTDNDLYRFYYSYRIPVKLFVLLKSIVSGYVREQMELVESRFVKKNNFYYYVNFVDSEYFNFSYRKKYRNFSWFGNSIRFWLTSNLATCPLFHSWLRSLYLLLRRSF